MINREYKKEKLKDIVPYSSNNKKHWANIDEIVKSIQANTYIAPIIVDENNVILAGHGRKLALDKLWIAEAEVLQVSGLSEIQKRDFRIRDNKLTELSDWDFDNLKFELEELQIPDLSGLFKDEKEMEEETPEVKEDDFEVDDQIKTDIVLWDLFEIGEHRLLCGDSTDSDSVAKLMNGEKADIMVSDPPYGIDLDTDYSKMGATTTKYEKIKGDDKEFDLTDVISISGTKEQYIWGGDYFVNSLDWMSGTQIIWAKRHSEEENKVFGSAFESLWVSYKCKKLIWFIRPINQSSERLGKHPTQKPIECMSRCIEMSKLKGVVYDAFLGSGSTMVAAHQLKRKCYGMELDPKYCQVIIDRMRKLEPGIQILKNGKEIWNWWR